MIVCDTWAQPCPGPPPRFFSSRCSVALVSNSSYSSLPVFSHLRTLPQKTGGTPLRGHTTPHPSWAKGSPAAASAEAGYPLYFPYIRTSAWYVLCFPYLRKNGGVYPHAKMSARRHF